MEYFSISEEIKKLAERVMVDVASQFRAIDAIAQTNTEKVLAAFQRHRVSDVCFTGSSGYGYNDMGRDIMDLVFADIMGTSSALV
ncbi:MAG: methionine gamma-lyase family protein, partial [Oscillospiraceae bacterium]|nr:methionine gamma-lyase family protein [Oscillospiraceae bacterium]